MLHRLETTGDVSKPQKSEVIELRDKSELMTVNTYNATLLQIMSLQVAEGDVIRGQSVPFQFLLPRYFCCPNTSNSVFSLSFQMSVSVTLGNGYVASETMDIVIKRYKWIRIKIITVIKQIGNQWRSKNNIQPWPIWEEFEKHLYFLEILDWNLVLVTKSIMTKILCNHKKI